MSNKGYFLLVLTLVFSLKAFSQLDYGLRGGLDYNSKKIVDNNSGVDYENAVGFHVGAFTRIKIPIVGIFVQPEVLYHFEKTSMDLGFFGSADMTRHKLNIPVLFGMDILLLHLYAGPAGVVSLGNKLSDGSRNMEVDYEKFNMSGVIGIGTELFSFMFDVRYQFGLYNIENTLLVDGTQIVLKQKDSFLMLSLAYKF